MTDCGATFCTQFDVCDRENEGVNYFWRWAYRNIPTKS